MIYSQQHQPGTPLWPYAECSHGLTAEQSNRELIIFLKVKSSGDLHSNQGRTCVVSSGHASHTVLVGRAEPATEGKLWGGCCSVSSSTLSDLGALQPEGIYSPASRWPKGCSELPVQMCLWVIAFGLAHALVCTSKAPQWSLRAAERNRVAGPDGGCPSPPHCTRWTIMQPSYSWAALLAALDKRVARRPEAVIGSVWRITPRLRKSGPGFNHIRTSLKYELAADSSADHAYGKTLLMGKVMWIYNTVPWLPKAVPAVGTMLSICHGKQEVCVVCPSESSLVRS